VLLTALFYGFRLNATRTRSSISAEPSFPHGSSDGGALTEKRGDRQDDHL
jgi:hypothetical protein